MKKIKIKKILTVVLSVLLSVPAFPSIATAEDTTVNVVNVYNATTFEQALGSENTDIILWQDIVYTGSTQVKCNSIDLNGHNLIYESLFLIQNGGKTFRILDNQYQKNNHTSTGEAIFKQGIDIGDSTLIFDSGVIDINGKPGFKYGTRSGYAGSAGIGGTGNVNFYDGVITIRGGDGGDGGNGGDGVRGSYTEDGAGGRGGDGYAGGDGGCGIAVGTVSIFGGEIQVCGGHGGAGGDAGDGGDVAYGLGNTIRDGGRGGDGGDGGHGASGIQASFVNVYYGTLVCNGGDTGTAGAGGSGGRGNHPYYQDYYASHGRSGIIWGGGAGIHASLSVEGGTVIAQGSKYAAGIGGQGGKEIDGHNVIINGGFVSATGGQLAYDIGGGWRYDGTYGEAGELTVTGGVLEFKTKGKATNVANPSFKNCTVTGEGADYYEGTYNRDGKFTVSGIIVKEEPEAEIGDTPVKLVATFLVSRTSDITTPAPRGYVSFKENGKEIGTAVLEYSTHVDEGIRATAEFEWIPTVENPEFIAEYVPSSGDAYASDGQASYGKLERIAVTKSPDKVLYIEDTNFVDTGMELTAYYSNNFSEIITSGWTTLYDFSEYGDKEVKISYGGKETMLPITVVEKSLTKIELTKNPNKTVYIEGTNFDDTGMELTLYYDNETSETITTGWTVEYDFSKIGMSTAIISYGAEKISLNIPVVAKSLDRIVVTKKPDKMEYAIGTSFIDKGMELTLYYDNETFETITTGWTAEYDFSEIGQKEVRISYAGKETTLAVNVVAVSLERIAVTKNPNKIVYVEGTQFVSAGMELTLYYNNGTSQKVTSGWVTEYDFSEIGQKEVKISYAGKETTLLVSVATKTITQIEVSKKPNKLQYLEGEEFSTSGMVIKAYYDNNSFEIITNYQVSGYSSAPGLKTITVDYCGQTATFQVVVLEKQLASIEVTKTPNKTEYIEGTAFDSSGMELTLYYNNNTSEVIIHGWTVEYDFSQPGQQEVAVSYGGKHTTLTATIKQKNLSRIEVSKKPNKIEYIEGTEFNSLGMELTVYYDNNTSEVITHGWTVEYDFRQLGRQMVTVNYGEKHTTFTVTVKQKNLSRIEVSKKPNKMEYIEGTEFDSSGMELTLYYDNNTSEVITHGWTVEYDFSKLGQQGVAISYEGKHTTLTATIKQKNLSRIEVSKRPNKLQYLEGEAFDTSGMTVTAYYDNNTSQTITNFQVSGYISTPGTKTITILYNGKTATFTVEVTAKSLTLLKVTTKPNKLTYLEGDTFDLTGMVVTAYYNNNTSAVVTDYMVSGYTSALGRKTITIIYQGKTDTFEVEVVERYIKGDVNLDESVTDADALYLLYHTIFGDSYPIEQDCDYNHDGLVTDADALYLLYHTIFGDSYPLN